jgi:hypothetical protein
MECVLLAGVYVGVPHLQDVPAGHHLPQPYGPPGQGQEARQLQDMMAGQSCQMSDMKFKISLRHDDGLGPHMSDVILII